MVSPLQSPSQPKSPRDHVDPKTSKEPFRTAAINLLPPEVLSIIFDLVVGNRALWTMDYIRCPWYPGVQSTYNNQAAIRLTHVCKLWRVLARAQPLLWNTIVAMRARNTDDSPIRGINPLLLMDLQSAGKDTPLNIRIDYLGELHPKLLKEFASRCNQLRRLRVDTEGQSPLKLSSFSSEAPLLESIYLTGVNAVAPTMFNNKTPRLTHLALRRISLPPGNTPTTLTHLTLASQEFARPDDLNNVISLIEKSSGSLRKICLEDVTFVRTATGIGATGTHANPHSIISLPRLTQLAFRSCQASIITEILSRVELPVRGIALDLHDCTWQPSIVTITSLIPARIQTRMRLLQSHFTSLDVSLQEGYAICASDTSAIRLKGSKAAFWDGAIPALNTLFPFAAVQTLQYRGERPRVLDERLPWSEERWAAFFTMFVSLTRLSIELEPDEAGPLLGGLTPSEGDVRRRPAPALAELRIFVPKTDKADMLIAMLARRKVAGLQVRKLHIVLEDIRRYNPQDEFERRRIYDDWETKRESFEHYVDEVEFGVSEDRVLLDMPVPFLRPLFTSMARPYAL